MMIYEQYQISDTDSSGHLLKIELRSDNNVQNLRRKVGRGHIAIQKQPEEERMDNLYFRHLEKSDQLNQLVPQIRTWELHPIE